MMNWISINKKLPRRGSWFLPSGQEIEALISPPVLIQVYDGNQISIVSGYYDYDNYRWIFNSRIEKSFLPHSWTYFNSPFPHSLDDGQTGYIWTYSGETLPVSYVKKENIFLLHHIEDEFKTVHEVFAFMKTDSDFNIVK